MILCAPSHLSLFLSVVATKFRVDGDEIFLARGDDLPAFCNLSLLPQAFHPSPVAFPAQL